MRATRIQPWFGLPLLLLTASALSAQDPCTLTPYDGTNENGLGAAPGFVIEYCSEIAIPPVCLDGGQYFINAVQVEATESTGASTMPITAQVRRAIISPLGPPPPDQIVAGPVDDVVQNVPNFPNSQTWVTPVLNASGRFAVGFDAIQLTSACVQLDGDLTGGQFLGSDETPATPLNMCWKGDPPGNPTENCILGSPDLRSLRVGLQVSPHGGTADGGQEVPPSGSPAAGYVRTGPNSPGGTDFWIEVVHDIANPTAAHIHNAPPGFNGPIIFDLGDPTSPIFIPSFDMGPFITELFAGDLYVNIHTAAFPGGEVRGQIFPASAEIFADGFESGDTSSWSSSVP